MSERSNIEILIADDDAQLVDMIADFLTDKGYKIFKALDSDEAIGILEKNNIGLVLLDIMMPKINGEQMFSIIKEKKPDATVIMITGQTALDGAVDFMNRGALDYLLKPFSMEDIEKAVKKAVKSG